MEKKRHTFTPEETAKSHEARKANKERQRALRDLLRDELSKPVGEGSTMTKAEWLTAKMVQNLKDDITVRDYKMLQECLGENVVNLNVSADGMTPAERLAALINESAAKNPSNDGLSAC